MTEALTAGLCASFILADGVTKSVGAYLLEAGVSEYQMPFLAGLIFVAPLLLFVWMLTRIPPPSAADVALRSARSTMDRTDRWRFFRRHAVVLTLLVLTHLLMTILRSVRADFAPEIWKGLGVSGEPSVFTTSETLVALGVMIVCGLSVIVKDNRRAFFTGVGIAIAGLVLIAVTLVGWSEGWLAPFVFMVMLGLGLYLPYVVMHTTIFERLIAMTRDRGNLGYLMNLADAFGYLGYVAVMLTRRTLKPGANFLDFFLALSGVIAITSIILLTLSWLHFGTRPVEEADAA
jgi:hypothetical protein